MIAQKKKKKLISWESKAQNNFRAKLHVWKITVDTLKEFV